MRMFVLAGAFIALGVAFSEQRQPEPPKLRTDGAGCLQGCRSVGLVLVVVGFSGIVYRQ